MIPVLCFAGLSLLFLLFLSLSGALSFWLSLLCSLGLFLVLHIAYFVFFWIVGCTVPNDRPIERQKPLIRLGVASMSGILTFYAGLRPKITGEELIPREGRFLFVCNHRSAFDPLLVMDQLRRYNIAFISKPSNLKLPLVGRAAYADGFIPIDRENNRNAFRSILQAVDYLKKDICSIGIYPEGTRSHTDELLSFHAGSFKIAQRAGVPIVVASVSGTEKIRRARLFAGTDVSFSILEVIPVETVCSMKTDELSEYVRGLIQASLNRGESGRPAGVAVAAEVDASASPAVSAKEGSSSGKGDPA